MKRHTSTQSLGFLFKNLMISKVCLTFLLAFAVRDSVSETEIRDDHEALEALSEVAEAVKSLAHEQSQAAAEKIKSMQEKMSQETNAVMQHSGKRIWEEVVNPVVGDARNSKETSSEEEDALLARDHPSAAAAAAELHHNAEHKYIPYYQHHTNVFTKMYPFNFQRDKVDNNGNQVMDEDYVRERRNSTESVPWKIWKVKEYILPMCPLKPTTNKLISTETDHCTTTQCPTFSTTPISTDLTASASTSAYYPLCTTLLTRFTCPTKPSYCSTRYPKSPLCTSNKACCTTIATRRCRPKCYPKTTPGFSSASTDATTKEFTCTTYATRTTSGFCSSTQTATSMTSVPMTSESTATQTCTTGFNPSTTPTPPITTGNNNCDASAETSTEDCYTSTSSSPVISSEPTSSTCKPNANDCVFSTTPVPWSQLQKSPSSEEIEKEMQCYGGDETTTTTTLTMPAETTTSSASDVLEEPDAPPEEPFYMQGQPVPIIFMLSNQHDHHQHQGGFLHHNPPSQVNTPSGGTIKEQKKTKSSLENNKKLGLYMSLDMQQGEDKGNSIDSGNKKGANNGKMKKKNKLPVTKVEVEQNVVHGGIPVVYHNRFQFWPHQKREAILAKHRDTPRVVF